MSGSALLALLGALLEVPTVVPPPPPTDPLELEFTWNAPPECPTAAEIEQRIRALLPGEPVGTGVLYVEGEVATVEGGVELGLRSRFAGHDDRRTLRAPSCAELGEATAVLLAIALEPGRADELVAPPETPSERGDEEASDVAPAAAGNASTVEDPTAQAGRAASAVDVAPTSKRRSRRPSAGGLRIATGLEAAAMPLPSGVLQGAAILLWPHARAELHGTWVPPRVRTNEDPPGARFQLGAVGLRGCGQPLRRAIELPLCVGAEAGATRARFEGTTTHKPWVAALASVGVARAWGPIGVWSAAELAGRIVGYRFLDGDIELLRQFPVSVRLLVGIELRRSWKPSSGGH